MHDFTALNPALYEALKKAFRHVCVSNTGVPADFSVATDFWGKKVITIRHWGECYSVSCPFCGDRRTRLYISHIWGTKTPEMQFRLLDPIVCHNEGCNTRGFWNMLYSEDGVLALPEVVLPAEPVAVHRMDYPCPVEDLIPLTQLPESHPAAAYMRGRGFDLKVLTEQYGLCYCPHSDWKREIVDSKGNIHYVTPADRIIIPNIQNGAWYGWQSRYIGAIPKDPTTGKSLIQKYLNAPGYSMGHTLYNLDNVIKTTNGVLCFVNEGPISAMACQGYGVATFGMYPKPMQEELLAQQFANGQIFFLVEAEANNNARLAGIMDRLNKRVALGCKAINLPAGVDAVDLGLERIVALAEQV